MKSKWLFLSAIPLMFVLTSCGRTEINLNDYLSVTMTGYDTMGQASYTLDGETMLKDNAEAFGLDEKSTVLDAAKVWTDVSSYLHGDLDKTEDLSNGEVIHFKWENGDMSALEDSYKVKLVGTDYDITVSGLTDVQEVNPFEYVTVSFSGIAPNGQGSARSKPDAPVNLNFQMSKESGLKNGDTVTVSVVYPNGDEMYYKRNGYIFTETSKQYTVDKLDGYAEKIADIPADASGKMDSDAQDKFKAYVAYNWNNPDSLKEIKLLGNYFLTPKDSSAYIQDHNRLIFVYEISTTDGLSYYYYTTYKNIMLLADGTCSMNLNDSEVPSGSAFFGEVYGTAFRHNDLVYVGYQNLDSLFNEQVTTQIGNYQYESTVS